MTTKSENNKLKLLLLSVSSESFFYDQLVIPFGLISLALVATVYLIDWFNKNFFSAIKFWIVASSIVLGTLIYNLFLVSLTKLFQIDLIIGFKYLFLETVYNLLITVIFFYALKRNFE